MFIYFPDSCHHKLGGFNRDKNHRNNFYSQHKCQNIISNNILLNKQVTHPLSLYKISIRYCVNTAAAYGVAQSWTRLKWLSSSSSTQINPCYVVCVCVCVCVCVLVTQLCATVTPWTLAHQASLSMGFCRQEYWSGLPFPSPEDLPAPGIKPWSPALQTNFPFGLSGHS